MNKLLIGFFFFISFVPLFGQESLEQETVSEFELLALEKAKDLGAYIEIVSDKKSRSEDVQNSIDLAVGLFYDEDRQVQVSSVNQSNVQSYPIRSYLTRLSLLKYDRVEIEWFDVVQVSDIKLGPDGKYYGVITVRQKFKGITGDKVAYEDITEKNIEIILDNIVKNVGGAVVKAWDVLLSDIKVVETRKI